MISINKNILNIKNPNSGEYEQVAALQGKSAYEIAVDNGFEGTEQEYLDHVASINRSAEEFRNDVTELSNRIADRFEEMESVHNQLSSEIDNVLVVNMNGNIFDKSSMTFDGHYYADDGSMKSYADYGYSKPLPCESGVNYYFANPFFINWLDENKNYISGTHNSHSGARATSPINAKYFILSISENHKDTQMTVKNSLPTRYIPCEKFVRKDKIEKEEQRILNVLCIGDSLTEGDYGSEPSGTINVHEKNYPYFMQKYTGFNVTNKGKCGWTTTRVWDNISTLIDFTQIKFDIVIIMLGTNAGLTDTLDADTSSNDYHQYANTTTGSYCKIIEYINEKTEGKAQIVLCTCPYVNPLTRPSRASDVRNANKVLPKIADKYNLPLIDVNKNLGLSSLNTSILQPVDGCHFGEIGYSRLGTFIGSNVKSIASFIIDTN